MLIQKISLQSAFGMCPHDSQRLKQHELPNRYVGEFKQDPIRKK